VKLIEASKFKAERAWGALDIAAIEGATVRLHWTDEAYRWHVNEWAEVFVVLDGEVDMHYREGGEEKVALLKAGDVFHAEVGDEHFAGPVGEARILVIERSGSV
jgi:mannose-6-phosphate isomerase-like protein (cupin superfamily)